MDESGGKQSVDDLLHKASVAADKAVTSVFEWPWNSNAQRVYAACVDAVLFVAAPFAEQLSALQQERETLYAANHKALTEVTRHKEQIASLEQRNAEIEKDNGEKWLKIASLEQQVRELKEWQVQAREELLLTSDDAASANKRCRTLETALNTALRYVESRETEPGLSIEFRKLLTPVEESGSSPEQQVNFLLGALNTRRFALIKPKHRGGLTMEEIAVYEALTAIATEYVDKFAPLPPLPEWPVEESGKEPL